MKRDLEEIKNILSSTTKGDWVCESIDTSNGVKDFIKIAYTEPFEKITEQVYHWNDCIFIAHSKEIITDLIEEVEELKTFENSSDDLEIMIEKCLELIKENKKIKKEKNILMEALEDISKYPECTQGCCSCCHHLIEIHNILIKALENK